MRFLIFRSTISSYILQTIVINICITHLQFKCGNYGVGGDYWAHMDKGGNAILGELAMTVVTILQSPLAGKS